MSLLGRWLSWDRFEAVREHEEILAELDHEASEDTPRKRPSAAVSNAHSKTFKYRR